MKYIRNTGALLMIAIFLIPAAGIYYNRHSCDKTGEVHFVLDEEYSCCAVTAETDCEVQSSSTLACCNNEAENAESGDNPEEAGIFTKPDKVQGLHEIKGANENCCLNEGQYLKSEEKYSTPTKTKLPHIEISITIAAALSSPVPAWNPSVEQNAHSPPALISSKNILLRNGVMLI